MSRGRKLSKFGVPHPQIYEAIVGSGLSPLVECSLDNLDKGLISAFVERWHKETNSFHLPFGEMTITLNDVSCLPHIPIRGYNLLYLLLLFCNMFKLSIY